MPNDRPVTSSPHYPPHPSTGLYKPGVCSALFKASACPTCCGVEPSTAFILTCVCARYQLRMRGRVCQSHRYDSVCAYQSVPGRQRLRGKSDMVGGTNCQMINLQIISCRYYYYIFPSLDSHVNRFSYALANSRPPFSTSACATVDMSMSMVHASSSTRALR